LNILQYPTEKDGPNGEKVLSGAYNNGVTIMQIAMSLYELLRNPNPDGLFWLSDL
jgi:hypothetical protein